MSQLALDPKRTAVLALHFQNDIVKKSGAFGPMFGEQVEKRNVIEHMARVMDESRKAGIKVIYTRVAFRPNYPELIVNNGLFDYVQSSNSLVEGQFGSDIVPELTPRDGDIIVVHRRASSFYESDLHTILTAHKINTLVVGGVATNIVVESTVRSAADYGYKVIVLEDCCTAASDEIHNASIEDLRIFCHQIVDSETYLKEIHN